MDQSELYHVTENTLETGENVNIKASNGDCLGS